MSKQRSTTDKCLQRFSITLGGVEREVGVRPIRQMAELRRKIGEMVAGVADVYTSGTQEKDFLRLAMPAILSDGIDCVMELPALYAPELAEACIEASEEELLDAGFEVLKIVFPFVQRALTGALAIVSRAIAG